MLKNICLKLLKVGGTEFFEEVIECLIEMLI